MDALISSVHKKIVFLKILFLTLLFIPFNITFAQLTVNGRISDPNFNPVGNATVEIFDQIDTLKNYTTITDASGFFVISNITNIENHTSIIPNEYLVVRNYPNPFNPSTIIYFEIPKAENIEIKIFDILGREVRSLFSGFHNAGVDQINWDGKNNFNQPVSAGIYLCQLKTKDHFNVHKMVFLDGGTSSSISISYNKLSNHNIQKPAKVNSRFNFTVKVTGDSLDATYFRNLICTKDTTLNLIVSKIIQTKTIGIDGGIVGNDVFKLTIPAGAFDGNYKISLSKIEDDGAFGENTVTPSFKLSGMPKNYSKPLQIIAKYSGELSNESYMGISKKVYDINNADSSIVYDLNSATDSLGYLVSSIPPKQINNLSKSNENEINDFEKLIKFLSSYTHSETEHFTIRYPVIYTEKIPLLAQVFEDAFTVVYDGFQMPYSDVNRDIILESIQEPIFNEGGSQFNPNLTFYVNKDDVYNLKLNDIQVGAVQGLFLPSDIIYGSLNWVDYSFYFWIEDLISDDPNYKFPKDFLFWGLEIFKGFNTKYRKDWRNWKESTHMSFHGQGMSVIVKYLREFKNMQYSAIGNYYRASSYQTRISEFLKLVEDPITEWWSDFFKKYLNNELYKLPEDYFIRYAHTEWDINSMEDISKTFTSTYQDLSAKIFKINFNYTEFDNSQDLNFELKNLDNNTDLALLLFSVRDGKPQYIQTSNLKTLKLDNIKSFIDKNEKQFLAIVVNNDFTTEDYLGQSDIELTVKVTPKVEQPACTFDPSLYDQCKISLWVLAEKETTNENGTSTETSTLIYNTQVIDGSFNGNTFTGTFESESVRDTITVILNDNLNMVESLTRSGVEENVDWQILWKKGYKAEDIPLNCDSQNKFESNGLDVCNKVSKITYNYTTPIYTTTLIDFSCEEVSSIVVEFSKK